MESERSRTLSPCQVSVTYMLMLTLRIMARRARPWACQRKSSSLNRRSTAASAKAESAQNAASHPVESSYHIKIASSEVAAVVWRYAEARAYGAPGAVALREMA